MTTITANVPDELSDKVKEFIEELGGEISRTAKPLLKKYRSLSESLLTLENDLIKNPFIYQLLY